MYRPVVERGWMTPSPLGEAKGSASRVEIAGEFESLASIDDRRVGVGCRPGRDARGACSGRGWCAPSIRSDCRHIRSADALFSLFRVAHSHPDHHGVAPEHALAPFVRLLEWISMCAPGFGQRKEIDLPTLRWMQAPMSLNAGNLRQCR